MTQLFLESMEEIGTIRGKVAEHDIKWPGLTTKSFADGRNVTFSLSLGHVNSQKNIQNSYAPSMSPQCSLSAVLVPNSTVLKPSIFTIFYALILTHLTKGKPLGWWRRHRNGCVQEEAWVRTGDYNEPSIKTIPNEPRGGGGELAGKEGTGVWLRLQTLALKSLAAWPEYFTCFRRVFGEPITLRTGWKWNSSSCARDHCRLSHVLLRF